MIEELRDLAPSIQGRLPTFFVVCLLEPLEENATLITIYSIYGVGRLIFRDFPLDCGVGSADASQGEAYDCRQLQPWRDVGTLNLPEGL